MTKKSADLQVIAPRQARSRATMERIVATTEELLAVKPFEQIAIAEISERAGCAPTAIYARFSDKNALLLEVHERFKQRVADRVATVFASPERTSWPVERIVATGARELVTLYATNHHMLRSVLLADNPVMYARAADLNRTISESLATLLLADVEEPRRSTVERDLDFAVRGALALLQQDLLFGAQYPSRFAVGTDDMADRIAALILSACPAA